MKKKKLERNAVKEDHAKNIDKMWQGKIYGVKAQLRIGLRWNSCFILDTNVLNSMGQLGNVQEALRKFEGYLVQPNPVGNGFELWIIPHWWKNPYSKTKK
jgi:hypothetical protein